MDFVAGIKKRLPFLLIGLLTILSIVSIAFLKNPKTLPFHHITIVADNNHIQSNDLKSVVLTNLRGGFFSLNVQELHQALLQLPWVYEVSFRRVWPNRLVVDVAEQQPIARWNTDRLMNIQGQLFQPLPASIPKGLPLLEGPEDSLPLMRNWLQQFSEQLLPLGLKIVSMQLTARHSLEVTLDDGLRILLGRENVDTRFAQLVRLYPKLIGGRGKAEYVDCRYPNGIAILPRT